MASLNKIIYVIGTLTENDSNKYILISEMLPFFSLEIEDKGYAVISNNIACQLRSNNRFFSRNKVKGKVFFKLGASGLKYYNRIKDVFDPTTDMMLFQLDKIEVF